MKRLYCIVLNIHIHTHKCFQNIVFSGSLLLTLLILSLYVCIYTSRLYITHAQTHTRSQLMSVSHFYVYVIERRGGSLSLSLDVCTLCGWVVENGGGEFERILELLAS
jgi:hypothetical protein